MNCRKIFIYYSFAAAFLSATPAHAWWDTFASEFRPVPLVREIEAESCQGVPPETIITDLQANGGQNGEAVKLIPDASGLTTDLNLNPGLYAIFTIARDPQNTTGVNLLTLDVTEHSTGQKRSWTLPVAYREAYFASGQMYFPAYAGGRYTITSRLVSKLPSTPSDPSYTRWFNPATLQMTNYTVRPLLVDRLELRDALGNCAGVAAKTRRMLTNDAELAALRAKSATTPPGTRTTTERQARNSELWSLVPDFNDAFYNVSTTPWEKVLGKDRDGLIVEAANAYESTANPEFGWDGAVLLCAVAEKYPALDYFAQAIGGSASQTPNVGNPGPFAVNIPAGKNVYRGWSAGTMIKLTKSYDKLFDFIRDNQALADFVGTRIPWVKTPADVIKLLDVNLLQSGMDGCNRTYILGDDLPKALIPLVQGINPVSEQMLDTGLFRAMCMNLTFRGGIADQAVNSYSRDGVHYIGSVGYLGKDLQEIGEVLHRYRKLGGAARFDVLDDTICPQMKEADTTLSQLRLAGGYRMIQGDAGDLHWLREPEFKEWPSRVLGGFGASILESGLSPSNLLAKRGVALMFGPGRGHAHQDTLNLELFAHGCRVSPDLGGREEGPRRGRPTMRSNRVHNLVEVDDRNFQNTSAGSTVSATGWNTSFFTQPGCQFMEHHGRATSHSNVTLYARQTALVDVGTGNSYLFDVFRVRGGKIHTYCFHGGVTSNLVINADMQAAHSASAKAYLKDHFDGTQREGTAPSLLEADWTLTPEMQKHYQGSLYTPTQPVTTRLSLFGHAGDTVLVGNAYSKAYRYNYPFLYVRSAEKTDKRDSVFPALIEPFSETPFITSKRLLDVTPASSNATAAVAVEVKTATGNTDLLFASGTPDLTSHVSPLTPHLSVAGKFAYVSRDTNGLRLAHLTGGTELSAGDITIKTTRREYVARLIATHYADRSFDLDSVLPSRLLNGSVAGITAGDETALRHAFKLESLTARGKGTRVTHEKTALYYRSRIVHMDEAAGTVETEIEPTLRGCDEHLITGTTITSEDDRRSWKASMIQSERWMHLGWPGYRGSWPDRIRMEDVPDTNGDGRHTLKMFASPKDAGKDIKEGDLLLELEVTRTTPDNSTFYFKMPANEKYQDGGWQFYGRWLVNEDGTRKWRAGYPGSTFLWKPVGGFKLSDFTDASGDGISKLNAYLFGPGDTLRVDTCVSVRRLSPQGTYEIRSNTPCTITLPCRNATHASISTDGKTFTPRTAITHDGYLEITLGELELADGCITLKLEPSNI